MLRHANKLSKTVAASAPGKNKTSVKCSEMMDETLISPLLNALLKYAMQIRSIHAQHFVHM